MYSLCKVKDWKPKFSVYSKGGIGVSITEQGLPLHLANVDQGTRHSKGKSSSVFAITMLVSISD